ncbi:hypothetical protein NE237_007901 [Protea cynaroides]|uniref:Uncharacterized protein n=1 Tax=Protea cynaroides TaxID=273540 RepID=A0A9Q0QWU5_9MAGN|nr:hypothetical protein NE237_007901 [Protea cynaroides]
MDGALTGSSIAKQLASCDKRSRDRALRTLKKWLPSQHLVPEEEMKKIWKGLFFCVWHTDKQPVQVEIINLIASLLVSLDLVVSLHYIEVFLSTMGCEWDSIDFLRLDKFYLLFRRFMHNGFFLLKQNSWNLDLLNRLMGVLEENTFLAIDKYPAKGVNYHISEIFLDELKPFLPIRREALDALLSPFFSVMMKSADKVLLNKIKSSIFVCLLRNGTKLLELRKVGDDVDSSDELVLFGTIALNLGLSSKFFDMGSSSNCLQSNRKMLFALHQEFLKLAKDLENSGIEILYPHVEDDFADEVLDLIPITRQEVQAAEVSSELVQVDAVGSADKHSKKKEKAKKASDGSGRKPKKLKQNNEVVNLIYGANSDDYGEVKDKGDTHDKNLIAFNESVIPNLQMQLEKVTAEVHMSVDDVSSLDLPTAVVNHSVSKNRKSSKSKDLQVSRTLGLCSLGFVGGIAAGKRDAKSAKKVRFSMKNNLVWKPHTPLPPHCLRIPPSVIPRGSAIKKGISPSPILEIPLTTKMVELKTCSGKKGRKARKSVSQPSNGKEVAIAF